MERRSLLLSVVERTTRYLLFSRFIMSNNITNFAKNRLNLNRTIRTVGSYSSNYFISLSIRKNKGVMLLTSGTTVILADMLPILGKDASWKITICHWVTWFRPGDISLLPITSYLFLFFYIFCSIDFCARVYLSIQFYYLTFSSIIYWTVVCFPILFLSIINSLWSRL